MTTCALMRISWSTVGGIISRVSKDRSRGRDRFRDLKRLGIDEVAYRKCLCCYIP